ncbi:MAG: elongation factor 3 [Rhodospirillaceae bacterium]|nr:elongation factor 3 [Rhodospirillaceae bacterium]
MSDQHSKSKTPLLALRQASVSIGHHVIFRGANISISSGDKICLVGKNGSGKSTLIRALAAQIELDGGDRFMQPGSKIEYLPQNPDFKNSQSVWDYISENDNSSRSDLKDHEIEAAVSGLNLDKSRRLTNLSGGELRRAAIARVLVRNPDVLLLDEPTNHLDLSTIEWLEHELARYKGGFLIVSHDRAFLRNLSEITYWIDREVVRKNASGFADFVAWSDKVWRDEDLEYKRLNKKIAKETLWLREGLTARRKRNMGRVRELQSLRQRKMEYVARPGQIQILAKETIRSGQLVIEMRKISKSFIDLEGYEVQIVDNFSTIIARGERVGLIGKNGSGKTTIVRMLMGQESPDSGYIKRGVNVKIIYYDQKRETLDQDFTVWKTLCPNGGDTVQIGGKSRSVTSYLRDFLFGEDQMNNPVHSLSGGERNRLLLARLFCQEHNFVVLDEPTNDLDSETLEVLEEVLANYDGTIIVVSHDREFLDRVVTSTIAIEGGGHVQEYPGGYSTYIKQKSNNFTEQFEKRAVKYKESRNKNTGNTKKKLAYKEQRELDQLPDVIDALEFEIETLTKKLSDPGLFIRDQKSFEKASRSLSEKTNELAKAEDRWLALETYKQDLKA